MDFGRRRKPCKHIYRLAIELGIFNANEDTVSGSIAPAKEINNKNGTNCSYVFSCSGLVPKNFVVIDFETANTCPDSICQMGIVTVENNLIVDRQNYLIRPPYEKFSFTDIHGISLDDVKNELTFGELWQRIKPYIEGRTIAAYNLPFDINCLFAALFRYEIPCPNFNAFDVLANVRSCRYFDCELSELKNYQLVTVAKKLKLEHIAHNALSDSVVTAQIQIYLSKTIPDENTVIYFSTISALTEAVAKNQLSPAAYIKVPRNAPKNIVKRTIITPEKFQSLLEKFPFGNQFYIPLLLLYHTGMRFGEVLGLSWSDIDFAAKKITLSRQIVYLRERGYCFTTLKTESSNRYVLIDDFLIGELRRWQTRQIENEKQFGDSYVCIYCENNGHIQRQSKFLPTPNGEKISLLCTRNDGRLVLKEFVARLLAAEGINAHSFRHTHATQLIESGAAPKGVAGRLGHTNTQITQNLYTHNTLKLQEETLAIFDKNCRQISNADKMQTRLLSEE